MRYACPECGYNAGENGEKILQLHMSTQHGPGSQRTLTSEQLTAISRENDVLTARTALLLGGALVVLGLGLAVSGYGTFGSLTCISYTFGCYTSQAVANQIRTIGFTAVFIGAQQTIYGGLVLFTFGSMGVAYWAAQKLVLAPRLQIVLLVGIFVLVLVTALAIAGGIIPFGQRIIPPTG
jgi:hypothetical protein